MNRWSSDRVIYLWEGTDIGASERGFKGFDVLFVFFARGDSFFRR